MLKPKAMIMKGPGTNCEVDTYNGLVAAGADPEIVYMTDMASGVKSIDEDVKVLVWAGGFSHGDDIKSGQIMAIDAEKRSGEQIQSFHDRGGLSLVICNGYQTYVRSGLLPYGSIFEKQKDMTLTDNTAGHFISRWVDVARVPESNSVWLPKELEEPFPIHQAHAEGRHVFASPEFYEQMAAKGQIALRFVDPEGRFTSDPRYNTNGSYEGVVGTSDESGRILGLMPHPERLFRPETHPLYHRNKALGLPTETPGLAILKAGVDYVNAA